MKNFGCHLILLLSLSGFLAINSLEAQRVGFDTENFRVSFIELPTHPVDFEYTAYSASISVRPDQLRVMGTNENSLLSEYINIPGLTQVRENGFFHVEVILDDFTASTPKISSGQASRRGSRGDGRKVFYMEVTIGMPIALKITDYKQEVLLDTIINDGTETRTFKSSNFRTSGAVSKHWNSNGASDMRGFRNKYISEFLENISDLLIERYGYNEETNVAAVYEVLGNSRHPAYDAHQEKFQTVKQAISQLKYDQTIPEDIIDKTYPVLDFWKSELKGLDLEDRQERRLAYSCLFNITTTYYWIEDLDNAVKYLKKLEELDMRSRRVGFLSERIHKTRNLFLRTGFTTKHIALEEFLAFDESKLPEVTYKTEQDLMLMRAREERLIAAGVRPGADEFSGTIYFSDGRDPIDCRFYVNPSSDGEISLLAGESTLIAMAEGVRHYRIPLDREVVSGFTFGEREFIVENYSPGMALTLRPGPQFMEVLYDSDKIQLLRFYPSAEASVGNTELEFVMRKGEGDDLESLHGARFLNWNRGLSRYLRACSELSARAGNGEFSRNRESLIHLAELYTTTCMMD